MNQRVIDEAMTKLTATGQSWTSCVIGEDSNWHNNVKMSITIINFMSSSMNVHQASSRHRGVQYGRAERNKVANSSIYLNKFFGLCRLCIRHPIPEQARLRGICDGTSHR